MIGVDKIEDIRKRARGGEQIVAIARAVGASEPTVRKRARMKGLSPEPPRRRGPEGEVLAPYEETVGPGSTTTAGTGASGATRRRGPALCFVKRI